MKRSWRLTPLLRARAPWLLLTHSWWTWAPPPRTHLHLGRCGDGGDGDDGQHLGSPRHPAAPFLPVATVVSCWPRPHLIREDSDFSDTTKLIKSTTLKEKAEFKAAPIHSSITLNGAT